MGAVVGIIGSVLSILFVYFFGLLVLAHLLDFSGGIGLLAAAGALVGGFLLAGVVYHSSVGLRVFSSRVWLMPIAIFLFMLALSPLFFEGSYCLQARKIEMTGDWLDYFSIELEGECINAGGLNWAMQQGDAIFRGLVALVGVILFILAFFGERRLPHVKQEPRRPNVSLLGDWPPDLALRLATPPSKSPEGNVYPFTSEMAVTLAAAARLNGGFVDMTLLGRLAKEPAFWANERAYGGGVNSRQLADFARAQGIEIRHTRRDDAPTVRMRTAKSLLPVSEPTPPPWTGSMEAKLQSAAPLDFSKLAALTEDPEFAAAGITVRGIAAKAQSMGMSVTRPQ